MLGNSLYFPQLVLLLPCFGIKHKQDCLVATASLTQQERIEQCKILNRCKNRLSPSCEFAAWEVAALKNPFISLHGSKSSSIAHSNHREHQLTFVAEDEVIQYGLEEKWIIFFTEGAETFQERQRKHQQICSPKSAFQSFTWSLLAKSNWAFK